MLPLRLRKWIPRWIHFWILASALLSSLSAMGSWIPDRRDTPSKSESGFLSFPVFSHIPGIGSTYGVGFLGSNLAKTKVNVFTAALTGDTRAMILGINEVHLIPNTLMFHFVGYNTRIPWEIHERGGTSSKENYFYLISGEYGGSMVTDFELWKRRFQLTAKIGGSRVKPIGITTKSGIGVNNIDSRESDGVTSNFSLTFDLTDDERDPRKGLNLQIFRDETMIFDGLHSRFHNWSGSATAYIPLPHKSVWAFNVFRSSAYVTQQNSASIEDLRASMGLQCSQQPAGLERDSCLASENLRLQERYSENQNGSASMLGGPTQLRGFPLGRWRGDQSLFYATEMRINLTDENTKFDLGFIRGTRSFFQIAPFYELGAVAEYPEVIENSPLEASYGVGFRLGFSGATIRADAGFSKEGPQFTFYVGYPWGVTKF
jgi:hypothetical protein